MGGITGLETSMILEVVKFSCEWEIAEPRQPACIAR